MFWIWFTSERILYHTAPLAQSSQHLAESKAAMQNMRDRLIKFHLFDTPTGTLQLILIERKIQLSELFFQSVRRRWG